MHPGVCNRFVRFKPVFVTHRTVEVQNIGLSKILEMSYFGLKKRIFSFMKFMKNNGPKFFLKNYMYKSLM